jgi:hypothetical protein
MYCDNIEDNEGNGGVGDYPESKFGQPGRDKAIRRNDRECIRSESVLLMYSQSMIK